MTYIKKIVKLMKKCVHMKIQLILWLFYFGYFFGKNVSWPLFLEIFLSFFLHYKVHKWKKCSKLKNKTTFTIPTFLVWYIKVILFYWFFTSESILWTFFIFIYLKCEKHRKIMKNMLNTKKQDHFYSLNFKSWYYKSDLIFLFLCLFHLFWQFLVFLFQQESTKWLKCIQKCPKTEK